MRKIATVTIVLAALLSVAGSALAGSVEKKTVLRRTAAWAAETLTEEMPVAGKVVASDARRVWLLVVPPGGLAEELRAPLSTAIGGLADFTEVYPKAEITEFVNQTYLHPREPRYDAETVLALGGKFKAAHALLIVQYRLDEPRPGVVDVAVDLSYWDARTAEKLWGVDKAETLDLTVLARASDLVMAGTTEEAIALIDRSAATHPDLAAEFAALRQRAEKLAAHREKLAKIQGAIDQNHLDDALGRIEALYAEGDPGLRDALQDFLADIRSKFVSHVAAEARAGQYGWAKERIAELRKHYPDDLDLKRELAPIIALITEATRPVPEREPTLADRVTEDPKTLLYVGAGLLAAILLSVVLALALKKRKRETRRITGMDELERSAAEADWIRDALVREEDLRKEMLRELDRSEDALSEAHHQAQEAGKSDTAVKVHEAAARIQELRRRVKLTVKGDPQDFTKGRLPRENLEGLLSYQQAVSGQIKELTGEAVAAQDSVAAGGDPAKNLKLLIGLAGRIGGKLDEREGYFTKRA